MKKFVAIISLVFILSPIILTACWDNRDIEELHIVTGIALDVNKTNDNFIDVTLQITNIQPGDAGKSQSVGNDDKPIIIKKSSKTIGDILKKLNNESNKFIFFHHIEVILFSMDLAKKGINNYIDFFLRDTRSRLEIPVIIVDGRAEDVLRVELQEENQSSIFLADSFQGAKTISKEIHVRLIDAAFKLACKHHCPIIPVVKVEKEMENDKLVDIGFVMFMDSKATTMFAIDDIYGYLFVKDEVHFTDLEIVASETDIVVLKINKLVPSPTVIVQGDKIILEVGINVDANIGEVEGFVELEPKEQLKLFEELLKKDVENRILKTFAIAQENKCDFYGISEMINKKNPRAWARLKDRWKDIFPTVEVKLDVKTAVKSTGQTNQTLEMEKIRNDDR